MHEKMMHNNPTEESAQGARDTQRFQQLGQGLGCERNTGPDMDPRAEDAQKAEYEPIGVDLSSLSGEIMDHIQRLDADELDLSQYPHHRHTQTEAFDLFHQASRQLKRKSAGQDFDTPGLKRRNAFRRSRCARNTLPSLRHQERPNETGNTDRQQFAPECTLVSEKRKF